MKKTLITTGGAVVAAGALFLASNAPQATADRVLVNYHDGTHGPVGWPAAVRPTQSTGKAGWDDNLSRDEYKALRESRQAAYQAWADAQTQGERDRAASDRANRQPGQAIAAALDAEDIASHVNGLTPPQMDALTRELAILRLVEMRDATR